MEVVEVPAGFEEMVCFAVAIEVESDAEWVHGMSKDLRGRVSSTFDAYAPGDAPRPLEPSDLGEVMDSGRYLPKAVAIAEQAFEGLKNPGTVRLEGDPDVLAHILEGMARWVVPALLERVPGPMDSTDASELRRMSEISEALGWSAKESSPSLPSAAGSQGGGLMYGTSDRLQVVCNCRHRSATAPSADEPLAEVPRQGEGAAAIAHLAAGGGCMKVTRNDGDTVLIEATGEEAATLAGRDGFTDTVALQDQLQVALADSWYEAGCPPAEGGDDG